MHKFRDFFDALGNVLGLPRARTDLALALDLGLSDPVTPRKSRVRKLRRTLAQGPIRQVGLEIEMRC